jgi:aminodeoxyfutalosine deaminase
MQTMAWRKFRGNQLFDGRQLRNDQWVLITGETGRVEKIVPLEDAGSGIEQFEGIVLPGLVNCHCHLELSHLKNVIPPHTGLVEFLCSVVTKRDFDPAQIQLEIEKGEQEMYHNGIVAVGDICNTGDAIRVKAQSPLRWQNFIEVLSFTDARATQNMEYYSAVLEAHRLALPAPNRSVLTPHAPYSISPLTFEMLNEATAGQLISVHNQENPAEDELYKTGGGGYLKLFKIFGVESSPFPVTGKSSIRSWLPHFNKGQTILLIHNSFMPPEDIGFANEYARRNGLKLVYCLCINANLYIENRVPPVEQFMEEGCTLVLGTDSYSSNWQLSIASEIQSLRQYFPQVPLETVLGWATLNGARALGWDDMLGSFEPGKMPGVTLLQNDLGSSRRIL